MSDELLGFDRRTAERVLAQTIRGESQPIAFANSQFTSGVGALVSHTVVLKITNTNPTNGFWKCKWASVEILATGSPAITFTDEAVEGWAYGLNDASLQQDVYYLAQFRGYKPDDGLALFVIGAASVVLVKCTNATPVNIGGRFIYNGSIQNFRPSNLTFNNAKTCWIHDANNSQTLLLNNIYLGLINGKHTDTLPIVLIEDFNLSFTDAATATTHNQIRRINWISTPTAYDPTKGDVIVTYDAATRVLNVRLNGQTNIWSPVFGCSSNQHQFRDLNFQNGMLKTVSALHF